jgi:hypothetical protein
MVRRRFPRQRRFIDISGRDRVRSNPDLRQEFAAARRGARKIKEGPRRHERRPVT